MDITFHRPFREIIYNNCILKNKSCNEVYEFIFQDRDKQITLQWLRIVVSSLQKMNIEQINDFLDGPVSRKFAGRKRIHDDLTCDTLVHMTTSRVKDRLNKVLTDFALFYAENINVKPSTSEEQF